MNKYYIYCILIYLNIIILFKVLQLQLFITKTLNCI